MIKAVTTCLLSRGHKSAVSKRSIRKVSVVEVFVPNVMYKTMKTTKITKKLNLCTKTKFSFQNL